MTSVAEGRGTAVGFACRSLMRTTREWRNWQTRTVEGRVREISWGFKSPLAHEDRGLMVTAPGTFDTPLHARP